MRTADDRIALGGRGAPYHFGSKISDDYDRALVDVLSNETDEFVAPLVPVLHDVQGRAVKLLTDVETPPPPAPPTPPSPGHRGWAGKSIDEAQQQLDELRTKLQAQTVAEESVGITIDWVEAVDNGATDL